MLDDYEQYEIECERIRNSDDLDFLKETIKEEMPEWLATLARYDDPSITDMEEVWGL